MSKYLFRYTERFLSKWFILFFDLLLVAASYFVATFLRFNFDLEYVAGGVFKYHLLLVVLLRATAFLYFKSYTGIVRHTSIQDANVLLKAVGISSIELYLLHFFDFSSSLNVYVHLPPSILFIDFFIASFGLVFSRLFVKGIYERFLNTFKKERHVIIYGAGYLGRIAKDSLQKDKKLQFHVLGFLDDNPQLKGKSVEGIPIYEPQKGLEKLLGENTGVQPDIIFAIQNISLDRRNEIVDFFLEKGFTIKSVPPVSHWLNGQLNSNQIRDINIDDLLEREPIQLNNRLVEYYLADKVILVTGAAGSIGSELVRQIALFRPKKLVLVDQAESPLYDLEQEILQNAQYENIAFSPEIRNVVNEPQIRSIFEKYRPEVVFHAAAYKHVPLMENNPYKAVQVNSMGTKILADLAVEFQVSRFVMVSTDKAVNPTNVMGASKRLAEMYVQSLNAFQNTTRFITTRFGNVLGSNGSVIPLFKKQIALGGPVTVTDPNIIRFFMTIPEACQLVLEAGTMGKGGEIYVFEMGKPVKILDLAKRMIKLSGFEPEKDIAIKITGLRPGEKLYEEVLSDKETTLPTHHNKILIANVKALAYKELNAELEQLFTNLAYKRHAEIVLELKRLVPEYVSQNSKFEELDKLPVVTDTRESSHPGAHQITSISRELEK